VPRGDEGLLGGVGDTGLLVSSGSALEKPLNMGGWLVQSPKGVLLVSSFSHPRRENMELSDQPCVCWALRS
jgi:hypothetical protein